MKPMIVFVVEPMLTKVQTQPIGSILHSYLSPAVSFSYWSDALQVASACL